jgi:hypothetical protein
MRMRVSAEAPWRLEFASGRFQGLRASRERTEQIQPGKFRIEVSLSLRTPTNHRP